MSYLGKQLISILLGILVVVMVFFLLASTCGADELQYRIDYENCLYDLLHADENNDDWDTTKVWRAINMGITFVEGTGKKNEIHDTISFAMGTTPVDTTLFYALSTHAASGGVLNVFYVDGEWNQLIALSKRPPEEFGKDHLTGQEPEAKRTYMFCEFGDTILVYPRPDIDYVMHIFSYKVSDWLDADSTEIELPMFHRLLALEMAYAYCQLMTGTQVGFSKYTQIKDGVLQAIFGLPPESVEEVQSLGIGE